MGIIVALIVGGLAGWLASLVAARDSSLGVVGNIVVGLIGAVIANFLFMGVLIGKSWGWRATLCMPKLLYVPFDTSGFNLFQKYLYFI